MKRNPEYYEKRGEFTYGLNDEPAPIGTSLRLSKEFNLDVEECHYHVDGAWYPEPNDFPCVFFDKFGYILIKTHDEYLNVLKNKDYRKNEGYLHINVGIHTCSQYIQYSHVPQTFEEINPMIIRHHKEIREKVLMQEKKKDEKSKSLNDMMKKMMLGKSSIIKEKM